MKITEFFIKHQVISIIINTLIMIVGLFCLKQIDLREYPKVEIPVLTVSAYYPNASSELVESIVTNILEDQLASVEGLDYIVSQSNDGSCYITLHFRENVHIDRALAAVRDAIDLAKPSLPKEVLAPTVQRKTKTDALPFMAIAVTALGLNFSEITHYTNLYLKNNFRSLPGVAMAEIWGPTFTIKVKLDPKKMFALGINTDEVYKALEQQSNALPVGKFRKTIPATLNLKLSKISDFENLFIKNNNGTPILLKSIANVELTSDDLATRVHINGQPGIVISITKSEDANPLNVSKEIRNQIELLKKNVNMPLKIELFLDQADFINASLKNIKSAIIEAVVLVLIIVFLFLRDIKATIIPLIAIPISLLGSIILLKIFGYTINTITLLAMVLAIGLVVDDAIVILENIKRHIESGLNPLQAAILGSKEISFAIVVMTFTLGSVYIPIVFIEGAIGKLFIEFAVALAGSVIISGIVALTLSPLMCSKFLTSSKFNFLIQLDLLWKKLENFYATNLNLAFNWLKFTLVIAGFLLLITTVLLITLPKEITPKEDRGLMGVYTIANPGEDLNVLEKQANTIENLLQNSNIIEAKNYLTFIGNWGTNIVLPFKDHNSRKRSPVEVLSKIQNKLSSLPSIDAYGWSIDSGLPGMVNSIDSSSLQLAISTIDDYRSLFNSVNLLHQSVEEKKIFTSVHQDLYLDSPGYKINIDQNVMARLGITPSQIARTIEVFFSGQHSLLFEKDHIKYPITLEGNNSPWTLNELYITNSNGNKISLGTLAKMQLTNTPIQLNHYNQMRTATLNVGLKPQQNIDQSIKDLLVIANNTLPQNVQLSWLGFARFYQQSSHTMWLLLGMSLIFIYAILAMQFESFIDPFIIMLTVPLASFGAVFSSWICQQSLNIYTQIGLITLIGLITKHGILIIDFANKLALNETLESAIKKASVIRLRPILMTTSAMCLGALPLVISKGAGFEARRAIGVVLIGGLVFGTSFTLFILPQFYYLIKKYIPIALQNAARSNRSI